MPSSAAARRRAAAALWISLSAVAIAATPCSGGFAGGYPCSNIDLRAFMPNSSLAGQNANDCWGWNDPVTGQEIAIHCQRNGTSFVDISNPDSPVYLGYLPTHTVNSSWRDAKTYRDHVYIVSEASGHGMQVFDLTQLRSVIAPPVVFSETRFYGNFGRAHNIAINEDTGYAYVVGSNTCSAGLHMVDITTPTSPSFAGCVSSDGYTHDAQAVIYRGPDLTHQGREIAFSYNEDTLTIFDVTVKSSPVQLSRRGYPGRGYTHQGWLTEDQRYVLLDDELDEQSFGHNTRIRIWDVQDLDNPTIHAVFDGITPAIDHNLYVRGNFAYLSNYRAGVRVLDISGVVAGTIAEVGHFDVYPSSNSASFNGAWSVYPYFDSGIFIVSGIEQGLFVLDPSTTLQESRCVIVSPLAGALLAGDAPITWKGLDPEGDPLTSTFRYSIDGGATYLLATAAPSSPAANPDAARATPFTAASFVWDTRADGLGLSGRQLVHLRVDVDDGASTISCWQIYEINNVPECSIISPITGSGATGIVQVIFDGDQPFAQPLTSTFEFSTNAGATFLSATAAASSPTANPDPSRAAPFSMLRFDWDSQSDGVALLGPQSVIFRITVDDGLLSSTCESTITATNQPFCLITAPAPGIMVTGDLDVTFSGFDPAGDSLVSSFQHSSDAGLTWSASTPAPTSATSNPDVPRPAPFGGVVFTWDTVADGIGGGGGPQNVDFRVVVDDSWTTSTCNLGLLLVDNAPTCALSSPLPAATVTRDVSIVFDIDDPSGDPVTSTFEFSSDGGATFAPATAAAGSPLANPDPLRATPATGLMFAWDSQTDGAGYPSGQNVQVRILVDDGALQSTCGRLVIVENAPSCVVAAPMAGSLVAGDVLISRDGDDPSGDVVTSTIEFSTDAGATFALATTAAGSPTANPDPTRATPFASVGFLWDSAADGVGLTGPQVVEMRVTASDGSGSSDCLVQLIADNQPTCMIDFPIPTAVESGEINVRFDADDPASAPLTSSFTYSTNGGATFQVATASPSSPITNPDAGRPTPIVDLVFLWDSVADGVGLFPPQMVVFRVAVDDGSAIGTCTDMFIVDNVPPSPTCTIMLPAGTQSGDIAFSGIFDSPSTAIVDVIIEHSVDGGISWAPSSMSSASATPSPAIGITVGPRAFVWDSTADMVATTMAQLVMLRATIDDGISPVPGECAGVVEVENIQLCQGICGDCNQNGVGPDVLDALEAARIAVGLAAPTLDQQSCCDVDASLTIDVLDSLFIAQRAAGIPTILVCP